MSEWVADIERIADEIHSAYEEGYADGKRDAVVHGHWEYIGGYGYQYRCSNCILCVEHKTNFCPHCGALMDEVAME